MKRILAIALALLFLGIPMALASPPAQEEVEGWHLVEELYMVPDEDVDVNGGPERFPLIGGVGLDYYQDSGEPDHVILSHWRTNEGGSDVWASCEWEVLLESPPPAYLPAGQPVSITVEHRVLETKVWEPPVLTAKFDGPDMELGYTSSSPNKFHHPYGEQKSYTDTGEEVYDRKATMTTENPIPEGEDGKRMAIYINYGWGYGMRYTYEWGVGYAATGEEESGLGAQNTAAPGSDRIFAPPAALATPGIQDIAVLWTSMNIYTVQNGAQDYYVIFALEEDSVVTELMTYHYL
ncbi:MAG: hypothetical protein GX592_14280, partial [Clostridiales bacterium]|nr:hypothetical protein [Clostridiales bacterium]